MNNNYDKMPVYQTGEGIEFDLLDLKVALLHHGIQVDDEVYREFEGKARLSKSPFRCSSMLLNEQVSCLVALTGKETPFRLILKEGKPVITHNNRFLTEISFHEQTPFYDQKSSCGTPFDNLAVIQGADALTIACLWRCEITQSGNACAFCHTGNYVYPYQSVAEMMEVVRYAVEESPKVTSLKLTAGSTFNPESEIDRYVDILKAVDATIGLDKLSTLIYLTPPSDVKQIDRLFDAGVRHIACDLDIWDERLFHSICPGKATITTRQRYLDALYHIADRYGPNRACCIFVAGVEPAESLIEGETVLAERGIIPWPSPLMRFGLEEKVLAEMQPFSIEYYRTVRKETAKLFKKYDLEPPGTTGSDCCLNRDIWLRRDIIAAE
jgi:hypothetical protein